MKPIDKLLQRWRFERIRPWLWPKARVLDIGCGDGAMFRRFPWLGPSVGIDPTLASPQQIGPARLVPGLFPHGLNTGIRFDVISLLAVLEHVPREVLPTFAQQIAERLVAGGRLLITVPSPAVDPILDVLKMLRIVDGMALEEHHGFEVAQTRPTFEQAGLRCLEASRFQLGLNNFFAFEA
jgi:2-polyprenyl-3-methyl-5-hydroxy-6-metoxy-1,4-benzoquinol methylase